MYMFAKDEDVKLSKMVSDVLSVLHEAELR